MSSERLKLCNLAFYGALLCLMVLAVRCGERAETEPSQEAKPKSTHVQGSPFAPTAEFSAAQEKTRQEQKSTHPNDVPTLQAPCSKTTDVYTPCDDCQLGNPCYMNWKAPKPAPPFDVPPVEKSKGLLCSFDTHECRPNLKRSCAEKSRFLLMSEDGKYHCLALSQVPR